MNFVPSVFASLKWEGVSSLSPPPAGVFFSATFLRVPYYLLPAVWLLGILFWGLEGGEGKVLPLGLPSPPPFPPAFALEIAVAVVLAGSPLSQAAF